MKLDKLLTLLDDMATYLELDGANSFKVSAYQRAVRALGDFDGDLETMAAEGRLIDIDGIGKGIAEKIDEFRTSGTIAELDELKSRIPPGLREMTTIGGFGPKKARAVHAELGIDSIGKLRAACEDGSLAKLKGFGAKTAEKILQGIAQRERFSGRRRLDVALAAAEPILKALREHPAVIRAEAAGSLRRRRETVGDLDFVAATNSPDEVMDFFCTREDVVEILGQGETKSSVLLEMGMQADLRCVTDHQFPFTIAHFTGSKEHNTRMRQRAKDRGLRLNEYGLFPDGGEDSLPASNEEDIYRHLGLPYIIPERREDMGEFDAAEAGTLPRPLEMGDLLGILHLHTHYSDGKPTLHQYAEWAVAHGIQWMGISDHSRSLTVANGLSEERVRQQHAEIDTVNGDFNGRVRLLKGIESDILADGSLDYPDEFLREFEWIVSSIHSHFNQTEAEQTARMRRAIDNPHTTVLGHLTGRLILARDGYPIDQKEIIRAAAKAGVAIEINANPMRLDLDWRLLHYAIEQGCRLCISPDAHVISGLQDTQFGLWMARKGGVSREHLLNALTTDEFLTFARARR
jgi:DNA polymerase (family 10)